MSVNVGLYLAIRVLDDGTCKDSPDAVATSLGVEHVHYSENDILTPDGREFRDRDVFHINLRIHTLDAMPLGDTRCFPSVAVPRILSRLLVCGDSGKVSISGNVVMYILVSTP